GPEPRVGIEARERRVDERAQPPADRRRRPRILERPEERDEEAEPDPFRQRDGRAEADEHGDERSVAAHERSERPEDRPLGRHDARRTAAAARALGGGIRRRAIAPSASQKLAASRAGSPSSQSARRPAAPSRTRSAPSSASARMRSASAATSPGSTRQPVSPS